jgi:hypothetical protein
MSITQKQLNDRKFVLDVIANLGKRSEKNPQVYVVADDDDDVVIVPHTQKRKLGDEDMGGANNKKMKHTLPHRIQLSQPASPPSPKKSVLSIFSVSRKPPQMDNWSLPVTPPPSPPPKHDDRPDAYKHIPIEIYQKIMAEKSSLVRNAKLYYNSWIHKKK